MACARKREAHALGFDSWQPQVFFFCWSSIFAWGICMALFWMAWRGRALWPLGAFQYQFFSLI
jgi:hypothetical protein